LKITEVAKFLATFFHGKGYVTILPKIGQKNILGDFLTHSSSRAGRARFFRVSKNL
jgi:hypothetical protein